jgi:hypothetical protein
LRFASRKTQSRSSDSNKVAIAEINSRMADREEEFKHQLAHDQAPEGLARSPPSRIECPFIREAINGRRFGRQRKAILSKTIFALNINEIL